MTKKTRNWLLALFIVAFPFGLFCGCLIFMKEPPKANPDVPVKTAPQSGTNIVSP
jgi:hypothetical protein